MAYLRFDVQSDLDIAADGYTVVEAGAATFLAASLGQQMTLAAGLVDPATGTPYTVQHVVGRIDEYTLTVGPSSIVGSYRGRDQMALVLEGTFRKVYFRSQPDQKTQDALAAKDTDWTVGTYTARQVAIDVVQSLGLALAWQARDYQLWETFEAVGNAGEILRRLVEPWAQVPMFRVDLFADGATIVARERVNPLGPVDLTMTAKEARRAQLAIRKRPTQPYGRVTLKGRAEPVGLTQVGGPVVWQPSEVTKTETSETFDAAGAPLTRVTTQKIFRMPEKVLLRWVESEYAVSGAEERLLRREVGGNIYETTLYDERGPSSQPRRLSSSKIVEGIHPDTPRKTWREVAGEYVAFGYEEDGFQTITTTKKSQLDLQANKFRETERTVKSLKEVEHLMVEERTYVYAVDEDGNLTPKSSETQVSAGLAPGGRRPPRTLVSGATGTEASRAPVELEEVISTDARARDVAYSNPHLSQADLAYLMDKFRRASGKWEWDLDLPGVAVPWLRKGSILHITGLTEADGVTPIPLQPALITEHALAVDESGTAPSMTMRAKAVFSGDA